MLAHFIQRVRINLKWTVGVCFSCASSNYSSQNKLYSIGPSSAKDYVRKHRFIACFNNDLHGFSQPLRELYAWFSCESSVHSLRNELHCGIGSNAPEELCRIVCPSAKSEWEAPNARRCRNIARKNILKYTLSSKRDHTI